MSSDAPAAPPDQKPNLEQVYLTVTPLSGAPVHFHVKRRQKILKLKLKLAEIYGIDISAFRLCWESEVLQNDQTFETIPGIEEDDLNDGLQLEMRGEQLGGS